jgi:ribulose bisphosphate carboxylase small subunit
MRYFMHILGVIVDFRLLKLFVNLKVATHYSLTSRTKLTIDNIISLLKFTLSNNYFIYDEDTSTNKYTDGPWATR